MEKFGNIGIYENLFPIFIKMNCYSLALLHASCCKKETFLVIFKQFMYYARPCLLFSWHFLRKVQSLYRLPSNSHKNQVSKCSNGGWIELNRSFSIYKHWIRH